jgi:hypothetical protein
MRAASMRIIRHSFNELLHQEGAEVIIIPKRGTR